jgi:hypothetical protein
MANPVDRPGSGTLLRAHSHSHSPSPSFLRHSHTHSPFRSFSPSSAAVPISRPTAAAAATAQPAAPAQPVAAADSAPQPEETVFGKIVKWARNFFKQPPDSEKTDEQRVTTALQMRESFRPVTPPEEEEDISRGSPKDIFGGKV